MDPEETSWETASRWYDQLVGEKGHYYHQSVIFPKVRSLLGFSSASTGALLDLGCGSGVFARHLPPKIDYVGVDTSQSLVKEAMRHSPQKRFLRADATQKLPLEQNHFDWVSFILSLQNMESGDKAIEQASLHLKPGGLLLLVLNHPCFRIPRQSHWGVDPQKQLQYRRIDSYHSPMKIPIQTNPGDPKKGNTLSFHHPLADYFLWLSQHSLQVTALEEWYSDKKSEGKKAKMEDRCRREFPLFLAIVAKKGLMPQ